MRARRSAGIWSSTMPGGRIRAWGRGHRSRPISTICRSGWQHEGAAAPLRPGYARPTRRHDSGKMRISTGRKATYRNRNAVARNRATSLFARQRGAQVELQVEQDVPDVVVNEEIDDHRL